LIISFSNDKGGVGKSTLCYMVGIGLAKDKFKVLIIDMDARCSLTSKLTTNPQHTIADVLFDDLDIKKAIIHIPEHKIDFIASHKGLRTADMKLVDVLAREQVFNKKTEPIKTSYDYIFLDLPASLSLIPVNAFVASDLIVIPIESEEWSVQGVKEIIDDIDQLKKVGINQNLGFMIIFNKVERTIPDRAVESSLKKVFPNNLFNTRIRKSIVIRKSLKQNKHIFDYSPTHFASDDFRHIIDEFKELGGKSGKR